MVINSPHEPMPRTLLRLLSCALALWLCVTGVRAEVILSDGSGQQVRLPGPASRLGLNEADLILTLALLLDDPVAPVTTWAAPHRLDPGILAALAGRFPRIADIAQAGSATPSDFSVESVVAQAPDLYVMRYFDPEWEPIRHRLEAAGIPVIYLDGPALDGLSPDQRVVFSLTLLGDATGAGDKARAYGDFVRARYARVARLIGDVGARPDVLVDGLATPDCCWVPGRDNRLGRLVRFAGGEITGSDLVAGYSGKISPEYLIATDPQVLIATGGPQLDAAQGLVPGLGQGLVLGMGITPDAATASLDRILATGLRSELSAVRDGRSHGILHLLTISPLDVLAVEAFARWIHPEIAAQIDPADTLAVINRDFLAFPLTGSLWVDQGAVP
ncbi:ABC transporter substrate-binding protein [Paracoccus sp. (in: a-proteobacteria)]|uniref:ABC transporter substrate-binding protein n=1 Tax=Paracoccus sp. TaxID=267 RepID=UPI00391BE1EB